MTIVRIANDICRGAERRSDCPLPGQYNVSNVVYKCHVSTADGNSETYTGCTKDFKTKCFAHIRSFKNIENKQTTLRTHIWSHKNSNTPLAPRWSTETEADPTIYLLGPVDFSSLKSIIYFLNKIEPLSTKWMNFFPLLPQNPSIAY